LGLAWFGLAPLLFIFYDKLIFISSSSLLHYGLNWWCVGSILGVFNQLLSLALFSEIRLLGIEGVVCVSSLYLGVRSFWLCVLMAGWFPRKNPTLSTERLC
jgi:hypothetical protein